MSLNSRKGLKDLLKGRHVGSSSKETPKSQPPPSLPPLPPLVTGLIAIPNLKKKRKEQEVQELKEGEVVHQETKKQKATQDKGRSTLMDSREDLGRAEVRQPQRAWALQLELVGAAIPLNSSIREFQRGHSSYIAEALKQPLLLPKDMVALRQMRQPDLFMSLKRDLAIVGSVIPFSLGAKLSSLFVLLQLLHYAYMFS